MKPNEAPEKIYLHPDIGDKEFIRPWLKRPFNENSIEYTRTDAFIEKACEFLANGAHIPLWEGYNGTFGCDTAKLVQNFKNYMKGE